jgi:hypothetical protein
MIYYIWLVVKPCDVVCSDAIMAPAWLEVLVARQAAFEHTLYVVAQLPLAGLAKPFADSCSRAVVELWSAAPCSSAATELQFAAAAWCHT